MENVIQGQAPSVATIPGVLFSAARQHAALPAIEEGGQVITYGERNDAMVNVNILNAKQPILRVLEKGSYLKGERFAYNRKGRPMTKKASRGVLPAFNFFKTAQQQAAAKMQTAVNDVLDKTIALATRD